MKRTVGFVIVGLMIVLGLLSLVWTPYDPLHHHGLHGGQVAVAHGIQQQRAQTRHGKDTLHHHGANDHGG